MIRSNGHSVADQDRPLASIVTEIKDEVKDFAATRLEMLKAELQEAVVTVKRVIPAAAAAMVLLATAYVLFALAVVGLVAVAFWNNPYRWFFAFLIVAVLWAVTGALTAWVALRRLRAHGLFPKKTVQVLKADKMWLQNQARSEL
jgi:uncharacterized membrane protein YqjE